MAIFDSGAIPLLSNASVSQVTAVQVPAGRWCFEVDGGFSGATVSLVKLGPDGTSFISVGSEAALTAEGAVEVVLPSCSVKALVAGGSPSALYANLSRIGD